MSSTSSFGYKLNRSFNHFRGVSDAERSDFITQMLTGSIASLADKANALSRSMSMLVPTIGALADGLAMTAQNMATTHNAILAASMGCNRCLNDYELHNPRSLVNPGLCMTCERALARENGAMLRK